MVDHSSRADDEEEQNAETSPEEANLCFRETRDEETERLVYVCRVEE